MKSLVILFSMSALQLSGVASGKQFNSVESNRTCNSYESESLNEGKQLCVYNDHIGSPIIGVGFNLERNGARQKMLDIGADYELVRSGKACLSENQVERLFNNTMVFCVRCVSSWLASVWSKMSEMRRSAVADMCFSMGCSRVKTFKKMKAALQRHDYEKATYEMRDSRWCRQVRSRCDRATRCMQHE